MKNGRRHAVIRRGDVLYHFCKRADSLELPIGRSERVFFFGHCFGHRYERMFRAVDVVIFELRERGTLPRCRLLGKGDTAGRNHNHEHIQQTADLHRYLLRNEFETINPLTASRLCSSEADLDCAAGTMSLINTHLRSLVTPSAIASTLRRRSSWESQWPRTITPTMWVALVTSSSGLPSTRIKSARAPAVTVPNCPGTPINSAASAVAAFNAS